MIGRYVPEERFNRLVSSRNGWSALWAGAIMCGVLNRYPNISTYAYIGIVVGVQLAWHVVFNLWLSRKLGIT